MTGADGLDAPCWKMAKKPRLPIGMTLEKLVPGPVVDRTVTVPAAVAKARPLGFARLYLDQ